MSTRFVFLAIVVAVLTGLVAAAGRIGRRRAMSPTGVWATVGAVVVVWLIVPGVLASRGALDVYAPLPTLGAVLMLVVTLGTIALAVTQFGSAFVASLPLAAVVGYQAFRLPVELVLHRLYTDGVIPEQMTYAGRNFDIVTGISAIVVAALVHRKRCPRWLLDVWNLGGLALLINIVAVSLLSTPVPFRQFTNEPANLLPSTFPYVWLPTFLVQAALFGHVVVMRRRDE